MKCKRKNLKILLATEICVFDFLVIFVASAAWFSAQRAVSQDADTFKVTNYTGLVTNISIHTLKNKNTNYDYNESPKVTYEVLENGGLKKTSSSTEDPFSMGQYDQLESPNNSVLYIITLDTNIAREQKKISFTANTTGTKENSPLNQGRLQQTENSLSSIVQFYQMKDNTIFDKKTFEFTKDSLSGAYKFYTLKTSDITDTYIDTYNTSFSFIHIDNLDTFTGENMYIEFICDYDTEALEDIYNLNVGSEILDSEDTIKFKQDWSMEIK